ncbi:SAM-dependent methyltransferase, partial [Mycolicibacter minnesotensis]|uniref:SAM-dependent methyltransferase n=2 Tax=Mycobacteriaceae TaxID=1762 RepID=UPI0021F2F152
LRDAGFDTQEPTAWAAEGLLPYLPADGQDLLFERIHELSAPGSRIGVESFGAGFFDSGYLESRREQLRQLREQAGDDADAPDVQDLWFIEERTDVAEWLMKHGWRVSSDDAGALMERYGRPPTETTPRTAFVEGVRV